MYQLTDKFNQHTRIDEPVLVMADVHPNILLTVEYFTYNERDFKRFARHHTTVYKIIP